MDGEREPEKAGQPGDAGGASGIKDRILGALVLACREGRDDVTFFVEQNRKGDEPELIRWMGVESSNTRGSFDLEIDKDGLGRLPPVDVEEAGRTVRKVIDFVRLQVSSVKKRVFWSVTARIKYEKWTPSGDGGTPVPAGPPEPKELQKVAIKWEQKYPIDRDLGLGPKYLAGFGMTCKLLFDALAMRPNDTGLILVSGQTGSGKSEILRGVMHRYLELVVDKQRGRKSLSEKRNPHVLTLEDPIETLLLEQAGAPHCFTNQEIDYTPRVKGVDAENLAEVINSALRQKPALLFVGEIREAEDIRLCLEFAGTGHLVFATTHAGSLLEGMQRALGACEAHDAGTRAIWVPKIRAVVHLKSFDFPLDEAPIAAVKQVLLPAMYVNNALAQHALVSDGLAALLPCAPAGPAADGEAALEHGAKAGRLSNGAPARPPDVKGALGRRYFAHRVYDEMLGPEGTLSLAIAGLAAELAQAAASGATESEAGLEDKRLKLDQLIAVRGAWERNLRARGPGVALLPNLEAMAISADLIGE